MLLDDFDKTATEAAGSTAMPMAQGAAPVIALVRIVSVHGERAWVLRILDEERGDELALAGFTLASHHVGQAAAAMRLANQLVLLGLVPGFDRTPSELAPTPMVGTHQVIEAQGSLTLRCGEASISLNSDGSLVLRGRTVASYARGTQRIRGTVVEIN